MFSSLTFATNSLRELYDDLFKQPPGEEYLASTTSRLQAAIMFLRLIGLETLALGSPISGNFSDAAVLAPQEQATLGYLKENSQLGWIGSGDGKFRANDPITKPELFKVALTTLNFIEGVDFTWANVITDTNKLCPGFIIGESEGGFTPSNENEGVHLTNAEFKGFMLELLNTPAKGSDEPFVGSLISKGIISPEVVSASGLSIIESIDCKSTFPVFQNNKVSLPETAVATFYGGTKKSVEITWPSVDTSNIGSFQVEGSIDGYSNKIVITVSVAELPHKSTYRPGEFD